MDEITMEQWEMGIYEDAVETWGREAQLMKAAEELRKVRVPEPGGGHAGAAGRVC